ncbi:MAG TPA: flagellar export chaperone FliS [Steroidobacteraceae bacterium]|nr:flagellar export chaperone FliS [Steroidobacteraceae bacterium]
MPPYPRSSNLAAYRSVAVHGGIAADNPHQLTLMLMDGALERLSAARGCLERGDLPQKARLLQKTAGIVGELRASLDLRGGGALAGNLDDLYEYMERQLLRANLENKAAYLTEVSSLLTEVRSAWAAIGGQNMAARAVATR